MVDSRREPGQPASGGESAAGPGRPASGRGDRPVIGLEVHARLRTASKLFCACPADADAPANTRICPVCTGQPGALPGPPNREAIRIALRLALALGARPARRSRWARKAYFYPDLPRGYQITQHEHPLATGGAVLVEDEHGRLRRIALERIHVEEDAARIVHPAEPDDVSLLDFNRAGLPLVEIVTRPEIDSAELARRTVARLRAILRATGVSDARMERGSLRCDANLSLAGRPGARVELKNLNSLRALRRALDREAHRLATGAPGGDPIRQTRGWDDRRGRSYLLRRKEGLAAYRYFDEPDLPVLEVDDDLLASAGRALPPSPHERAAFWRESLGIAPDRARVLADEPTLGAYFDALVRAGAPPGPAADWLLNDGRRFAGPDGLPPVPAASAARLVRRLAAGEGPGPALRRAFEHAAGAGEDLDRLLERIPRTADRADESALAAWCEAVLADHPEAVQRFRGGHRGVLEFLVGRVMTLAGGRADPRRVREALVERLDRW